MPSLFEQWHPVTSDFGLICAPLESVVSELRAWHQSIGIEYTRTDICSSLADAFASLLLLSASKMRRIFLATHSDWVAFFQNGIQGSDPTPAMSFLAQRLGVLAMRVCSSSGVYPATIWELYAPAHLGGDLPLGYRRSVEAVNDGGRWTFDQSGEPFPFEQVERYSERRKRDRFTQEMLRDYLKEFGIELFRDDFFRPGPESPAVRLQQSTKVWHAPEFSLDEVAAGVPWQKPPNINP